MKRNGKFLILAAVVGIAVLAAFAVQESRPVADRQASMPPQAQTVTPPVSPGNGRVTLIDLGATECTPCKMMAPILEELKNEYAGKADILFIDVWKDPAQGKKYGVQAIPTQIFFDGNGREVFRHTGFMDKQRIVEILSRLGVS